MLRLHSHSSRPYPGRPVRRGVVFYDSAQYGNMQGDRPGVNKGHSRQGKPPLLAVWWVETSPVKPGGLILSKGRTQSMGNRPYVLRSAMNPNGGARIYGRDVRNTILKYQLAVAAIYSKSCEGYLSRLRSACLCEPPGADRWVGRQLHSCLPP